ncbi:MAG: sulfotransferase, partial [Bacillota bacterium]
NNIYNSILKNTPKQTRYVIDSSKTARDAFFRPFILSKNFEVKIIHLVRDGRGCMWSNIKGSNRKMEKGLEPDLYFPALRTAISWPIANLSPYIYSKIKPNNNYIKIKYENFVKNPEIELNRLGNYLDIDFSAQIDMLKNEKEIPLGHQLAGNRLRKKKKIILNYDSEWQENLNLYQRFIFWFFNWPWTFNLLK